MKKWFGCFLIGFLFALLILRYSMIKGPIAEDSFPRSLSLNSTNPLEWIKDPFQSRAQNTEVTDQVVSTGAIVSTLFVQKNLSEEVKGSLQTWKHMTHLINYTQELPNAVVAVREAVIAWESLKESIEKERLGESNKISPVKSTEKQCPYFLNKMNVTGFDYHNTYKLRIPCGLVQGSSITVIGIPNGLLGNFQIDLTGGLLPGEPDPPIILHYNIRLLGDKITEDPVIVQNTWSTAQDWGPEERCPSPVPEKIHKVDDLIQCNEMVGKEDLQNSTAAVSLNNSTRRRSKARKYFPFKQNSLFVMTLRVGEEGFQMTVDGKHITSFAYRQNLEPWLVNEVKVSGDVNLISVVASGLPTAENSENILDLKMLKSNPVPPHKSLDLFIGVFSTTNNFKRRMAVRRSWMQYTAVRSGTVVVRFFVGMHKSQIVNEELLKEAFAYGDIQLMPFVDYYSLITWKSIAICIFGTQVVSAGHVMKTDDDSFVRIDEVLFSLKRAKRKNGLLYGLINSDAKPHRSRDSKWYITPQEWGEEKYPPWAHGPGYVVSSDIAKAIYQKHKIGKLKMFKLEDVAMGIWIGELKNEGLNVKYVNEERVCNVGCKDGYVVAHYQTPRLMLCLWQKLERGDGAKCCEAR